MKRTLSLVALSAIASMAAPIKFGAGAAVGYDILSVGDDLKNTDANAANFGVAVGPNASYMINDKFSVGAGINFQFDMYGTEEKYDFGGESFKTTSDVSLMTLGFQIAPAFQINEKFSVKAGYEWDMPLAGTATVDDGDQSVDYDIVWAPSKAKDLGEKESPVVSTHNIVLGGSYAINEKLDVTLQGKFALNGSRAEYKDNGDLKGARKSSENIAVHQIAIGVNYSFANLSK